MGDDEKLPNISVKQCINHKPTMASTGITEVIFYCEKTINFCYYCQICTLLYTK